MKPIDEGRVVTPSYRVSTPTPGTLSLTDALTGATLVTAQITPDRLSELIFAGVGALRSAIYVETDPGEWWRASPSGRLVRVDPPEQVVRTEKDAKKRGIGRNPDTNPVSHATVPVASTRAPVVPLLSSHEAPDETDRSLVHQPEDNGEHPNMSEANVTEGVHNEIVVLHAAPGTVLSRRARRESFLQQTKRAEPATKGWRGTLTRMGLRMAPGEAELAERADAFAVSQHWPGPRTIAIVNGKGGAGKTPSTVLLAAVFARYGGAGVLTWDNNQTRGTLGWRTEQGPHAATLLDLLPQYDRLLGTGAQSADLAHFVHHQTRDKYDVLRSKPDVLASEQRVTAKDVDAIHSVAAKYYRLTFIDSGNDETDPMWLRMIHHADQLVVATTTRDDHAEAGALLLEALADRDEHSAQLARGAVVIVSQADPKAQARDVARVAEGYAPLARDVATIPHDHAMVDGVLNYDALNPKTRRAWLTAAAAVARGL